MKDERSNVNVMTTTLNCSCEIWVWRKTFKVLVLTIIFLIHVNMLQSIRKYAKFQVCFFWLILFNFIFAKK